MEPSLAAYDIIKRWESLRLRAYKALPTEKYYTIGYGHYSEKIRKNQLITQAEAELLLRQDVRSFSVLLDQECTALEQHQFDALTSLIYNIGWYQFRYSMTGQLAMYCNRSRTPEEVARRIVLWVRSGGKVILGLQHRRIFEANYFLGYSRFFLKDGEIIESDTKPRL